MSTEREARRRRLDKVYRRLNDLLFLLLVLSFVAFVIGLWQRVAPVF